MLILTVMGEENQSEQRAVARLSVLGRDERGTSIIELALVVPVLSAFLIGMVDLSRAYAAKLDLEQAAHRSIEKVMQATTSNTMIESLVAEATEAADVEDDAVTVDVWLECNGVRAADFDTNCAAGQTYARYLTVEIEKGFTPLFSTKFLGSNPDGTYTLRGEAGMRVQ